MSRAPEHPGRHRAGAGATAAGRHRPTPPPPHSVRPADGHAEPRPDPRSDRQADLRPGLRSPATPRRHARRDGPAAPGRHGGRGRQGEQGGRGRWSGRGQQDGQDRGRNEGPAGRRSRTAGMLAAAPMIGLLVALCLVPGAAPRAADAARAAAPPPAAHPPTRDYDLDLPPLQPAVPDTGTTTTAGPPTPPTGLTPVGPDGQPLASITTSPPAATPPSAARTLTLTAADRRIPARMLTAYRKAAARTAADQPGCHLRWQLLAGIGRIESGHGVGRAITAEGTITSRILGPALDGHDGRALVRDTDGGRLDGDRRYDRAVGPMQFIPTTWAWAGRDGSGDGQADPNNVDDATLSAAGYLCRHDRDLADPAALRAAVYSYNPSSSYLRAVLAWTAGYTTTPVLPGADAAPPATPAAQPTATPPAAAPAQASPPRPTATPSPSATATAPAPVGATSAAPTALPSAVPSAPARSRTTSSVAPRLTTTPSPSPPSTDGSPATPSATVPASVDAPAASPSNSLLVVPLTPAGDARSAASPTSAS
ncbi:membrane-bound lytic murein transglycosylase B [Frankia torreyi]|uniref:Membrane-bound lytic murein transglycosylase B n=2 Tax=Frankia TaxID=1854 RepID=A0A0D8BEN4_9ACTN|nr:MULTISPECIES: lytic murein transglycosylase [Frankia]KJE21857.1 membrane-bound lytic murein transglycosylase B [Frankia torreyi]